MTAHRASKAKSGFAQEISRAVTPRAALLVLGVLVLHLAFITSYLGAFHSPSAHRMSVALVAPQQAQQQLAERLDGIEGEPVKITSRMTDRAEAEQKLKDRDVDGALVVDPSGRTDTLLVAGGAGGSLAQALEEVFTEIDEREGRSLRTEDVAPSAAGDNRGLSSFYVVVGWCIGGYLCSAVIAMSYGARPVGIRGALIRLGALVVYAVVSGVGGVLIAGPLLDALPGSFLGLAALGALIVFGVGAVTQALQALAGAIGIGLAILLIVVLGNPSAGGAYAAPLLPTFWREIGPAFPTGAGTWAARSIAYFDGAAMTGPLLVLTAWAVVGVVLALLFTLLHRRRVEEDKRKPVWAR